MSTVKKAPNAAVVREPSKSAHGKVIFSEQMAARNKNMFASNRDFRRSVLDRMINELGVSTASAATMYNAAKLAAEASNPNIGLGRDPKKEKPAKAPRTAKVTKESVTA